MTTIPDNARHGFFLTLEGADGSGKSTKARMLAEELEAAGREVVLLREPGGTPISERIREILLDSSNSAMTPECELMLYEASRAQLVQEVIIPALRRGAVVVCDRFYDSTYAYQACAREMDRDLVRRANALGSCGLVPDRTIFFDLPTEESFERATRHGIDRMEAEGIAFQDRVRAGFLEVAQAEPGRVRVVNGSGEKAEVYERMAAQLADVFPELRADGRPVISCPGASVDGSACNGMDGGGAARGLTPEAGTTCDGMGGDGTAGDGAACGETGGADA